ncbi:MAG: TolB family protein [Desulfonatronovibrio sp.]
MVQTNPTWSHDGQTIAYSATSTDSKLINKVLDKTILNERSDQTIFELNERYPVKFDIYTIDFNQGKGGTPEPLKGASNNGYSNYFPRYSPDGKWIVFTRSPTGLVLQPDSELWIFPAEGGW